ncbi:type II toxin-antitoxin system VapC family toxin [Pyrococcus kukulkanii]|uniref:Type II toxin-antitoxin system VapC family toxin n=1 Tax=Pyrococcus kukulkanii TaxID=1609559 RepID=A0ABV4T2B1_9EURY
MIVIDASILAKIILKEEGWEQITLTPSTITLNYAFVECTNAIWKAVRRNRIPRESITDRLEVLRLIRNSLIVAKVEDFFERGLEIALDEGITVYDAFYIALAESLDARLITADERQYEVAKNYVPAKLV